MLSHRDAALGPGSVSVRVGITPTLAHAPGSERNAEREVRRADGRFRNRTQMRREVHGAGVLRWEFGSGGAFDRATLGAVRNRATMPLYSLPMRDAAIRCVRIPAWRVNLAFSRAPFRIEVLMPRTYSHALPRAAVLSAVMAGSASAHVTHNTGQGQLRAGRCHVECPASFGGEPSTPAPLGHLLSLWPDRVPRARHVQSANPTHRSLKS